MKNSIFFSSELNRNLYPIKAEDYFNFTKISSFNLNSMKLVLKRNIKNIFFNNKINILDWGCGNSLWPIALFPGASITGIDISEDNIKYSKMNAKFNSTKFIGLLYNKDFSKIKKNFYDHAISISLIEFLDEKNFKLIFSLLYKSLKPGGKLFITHHNYRIFSAVYIPWIIRGGYPALKKKMGMDIQRKKTPEVVNDFLRIGYEFIESGAFNPYPNKLWKFVFSDFCYMVKHKFFTDWYYTQYIVLQKPHK